MKTRLPILTSEDILNLAYDLRSQGFNIDVRHFIDAHRVEDVLLGIEQLGELEGPERLKTVLAPIFCSTPEEQSFFYGFFDNWMRKNILIKQNFSQADNQLRKELGLPVQKKSFWRKYKWSILSLAALVAIGVIIKICSKEPPPPPKTNILEGFVLNGIDSTGLHDVRLEFLDREVYTDEQGYFSLGEFEKDTFGVLFFSKPEFLEEEKEVKSISATRNDSLHYFWPIIHEECILTVEVVDQSSMLPVEGAEVEFLDQVKPTNAEGLVSFYHSQMREDVRISIHHPDYNPEFTQKSISPLPNHHFSIALQPPAAAQEIELNELADRINNFKKEFDDEADTFYRTHYKLILVLSLFLPLFIFFLWLFIRWLKKPLILERESTLDIASISRINVEGKAERLFKNAGLRRVIQQFRNRVESSGTDLDIEKTVEKSIEKGGLFTASYRSRFVLPEYLVLIDRESYDDQQALFIIELISRFTKDGVFMDHYYFKHDPRYCTPSNPNNAQISLTELNTRFPGHRLLIFSDASGFINPLSAKPQKWVNTFSRWFDTALFIPERTNDIRYLESTLEETGINVWPASSVGLHQYIESLQIEKDTIPPQWDVKSSYPELFDDKIDLWLQKSKPDERHVKELFRELNYYLDSEGQKWLRACAIYPEMRWELTLYLTNELIGGKESLVSDEEQIQHQRRLFELVRLPWFRYGSMPDWLRLLLIAQMSRQEHQEVRVIVKKLLDTANREFEVVEEAFSRIIKLPVAKKDFAYYRKYLKSKFGGLFKRADFDNPMTDNVFVNFVSGGRKGLLSVIIPDRVKKVFFRNGQAIFGLRPIVRLLFSIILGGVLFTAFKNIEPPVKSSGLIPEFSFAEMTSMEVEGAKEPVEFYVCRSLEPLSVYIDNYQKYSLNRKDVYSDSNSLPWILGYIRWLNDKLFNEIEFDTTRFEIITAFRPFINLVGEQDDYLSEPIYLRLMEEVKSNTPDVTDTILEDIDPFGGAQVATTLYPQNVFEFIEFLGPDRTIKFKKGKYNLAELVYDDWNKRGSSLFPDGGISARIVEINNLVLEGNPSASILTDPDLGWVLTFENCKNVTITNLTFGHTEGGGCTDGVLRFIDCEDITINTSNIFGSGTVGLEIIDSRDVEVNGSRVYECTSKLLFIENSEDIRIVNGEFSGTGYSNLIDVQGRFSNVHFISCKIVNNTVADGFLFNIGGRGKRVYLSNSDIMNNLGGEFVNDIDLLEMKECEFKTNTFKDFTDEELRRISEKEESDEIDTSLEIDGNSVSSVLQEIFNRDYTKLEKLASNLLFPNDTPDETRLRRFRDAMEQLHLPFGNPGGEGEMLYQNSFIINYNTSLKIPNWVAYYVPESVYYFANERSTTFSADPDIENGLQASIDDYRNSGYDRGHLASVAHFGRGDELGYYTNIAPQNPNINRRIWKELENRGTELVESNKNVWTITGTVIGNRATQSTLPTIGEGKIAIPASFYKIYFIQSNSDEFLIEAYLVPNESSYAKESLDGVKVYYRVIEELTGLDFLSILKDDELPEKAEESGTYNVR